MIDFVSSHHVRVRSNIVRDDLYAYLKSLEREGWELMDVQNTDESMNEAYYFKRSIHPEFWHR